MRGELHVPIMSAEEAPDPQLDLLTALTENNVDALRQSLTRPGVDLNHVYKPPYSGTALHFAVRHGQTAAVAALLAAGARTDVRDRARLVPLHLAVKGGHDAIVRALLEHGADVNSQDEEERGVLHLLALQWGDSPAQCERVLETLLAAPGLDVDGRDCSGCSPLLLAARRGAAELCRRLVERGADLDCRVGPHCARDLLQKKFPWLLEVTPTPVEVVEREPGRRLYEALRAGDKAEFSAALARVRALDDDARAEALERAHGNFTCLQFAADNGLEEEVGELLEAGADVGSSSSGSGSPVEVVTGDRRPSAFYYACYHGYHYVLEKLLEAARSSGREVNLLQPDATGATLLHQLTRRAPQQRAADPRVDPARCLRMLLGCGLPVGVNAQDRRGNTPLHFAALHEDQSLVAPLLINGANIGIANQFGTMPVERIQPAAMEAALDLSVRGSDVAPADHDFCISFHYDCLVPPGAGDSLPAASETAPLFFVGQSRRHQRLLHHPVLSSFLTVKWLKIQPLYLLAVALYAVFVAILTAYVYLEFDVQPETGELRPSPLVSAAGLTAMEVVLWLVLVLLVVRELWQLALSWRAYVSHRENILQVGLIVLLAVMLVGSMSQLTRLHIAVWVIILAWLEFVLLLGRHPKLSTYIMMFKTVSENFIKFIFLYSFLIIAFSIAFNLLFRTDEHFNTYWRALLKTVVMSTGEMEYTSLEFTRSAYSGHIAFFGFLFLIALVLMNLLNGLAVSDTAAIQADAELYSLIARVSLIHYTEAAVIGSAAATGGGCCGGKAASACLERARHWLAHRVLLFPRCAKGRRMTERPNADRSRLSCCQSHTFGIDKKVVEAAHALLARGEHVLDDRMAAMERKLDVLMKLVQDLKDPEKA
ncbi:Transient receptor potential cation channel protein painless [Amphibalanus amphitrite]|uniref:Transient receptor potential cation channel protein painless n=1 Tax=Amphibalanus amphitrite TaxID=1232801 RepID=A0A6A4XEQ9_AMPAM|nr:Transient receptor potential cation channel protein painless [Amphibalanus amphitrite]